VWTLVAAIGYVVLVILQDPAVTKFPDIPQGLLYLTGVSAAAYAGGKLVRDPGPIARSVSKAQINGDNIDFTVIGENLPKDASYRIDGAAVTVDPASVTCTAQDTSTQLCTQLSFTVQKASAYQKGDHVLQVVSSDGRVAEFQFTVDSPKIDTVKPSPLPKGNKSVALTITGSSFRANSKIQWLPPSAAQAFDLSPDSQSATQIVVTVLPGGNAGSGTITVVSPSGMKAVASVDVAEVPQPATT
jgi:hypothetical protein